MARRWFSCAWMLVAATWLLLTVQPIAADETIASESAAASVATPSHGPRLKTLGEPQRFDYELLRQQARRLADQPYHAPPAKLPEPIRELNWDQMQAIRFRDSHALWRDLGLNFRVRFFHLGLYNKVPVTIYELHEGEARRLAYEPGLFDYGKSGVEGSKLPENLGFAGFQLAFHSDWRRDVAAFQGASYFRAVSDAKQYGLSARGLAVDCGLAKPEEFPIFTAFWLQRPAAGDDRVTVYALLDSPSVAGAYRFVIAPGEPLTMDVDAAVYPRQTVESLGIAPLTSMFFCGENDHRASQDFRPEIHDSDGLALWTGAGERIWRPLVDPTALRVSSFADDNPRGFGLLQRDRNFDHYQDDGVYYDRRPSLWVQPKTTGQGQPWGKGAVRLVEIPTAEETFDNVVAFWQPADIPGKGDSLQLSYRLTWGLAAPDPPKLATVTATRTGIGGVVGQRRSYYSRRFVVDFAGGELASLGAMAQVEPVITASRGEIELTSARPLAAIDGWRAMFDLKPTDDSTEPIELRLYLREKGKALSETWLYQWTPPPPAERKF
ncbi:MAG TPA: glucan biosynthesis protein D [Pirellulales bacterium]|nr:glucan biosynthesis protein D [Pirellulales bacterium]